jgi:colicin import membrane protein
LDPRVRAMKEAEKAEKEAKKRAKHEERNKEAAEKEAAEKAALAAAEAKANAAKNAKEDKKKQAEKEKKLVQKERKRLRAAVAVVRERAGEGALMPSPEQVDGVCLALDLAALKALADTLEPAEAPLDACAAALTAAGAPTWMWGLGAALEHAGEGAMRGALTTSEVK